MELRPINDENINQSKPFSKPYSNQLKQYPAIEAHPSVASGPSSSVDNEKRAVQTNTQQVTFEVTKKLFKQIGGFHVS